MKKLLLGCLLLPGLQGATNVKAGAINCTMTGLSSSLSVSCIAGSKPILSVTLWPGSSALTYDLRVGPDALTLIIKPTIEGHWSWSAAQNGSKSQGTL
jgi:hypothetical protein